MGVPAAKAEPQPRVRARARVRAKAQLTLPDDIRRALHIGEGDEVEFSLHDDGTVTVRGFVSIPTDQAWFFTPEWLTGEQEADNEIASRKLLTVKWRLASSALTSCPMSNCVNM